MKRNHDTKDKLLQVGFDLIWDHSYGSVSVDDICKRAGINKGSFYHFFPSKADLAIEAYEEHWKEKRPIMDSIFSPQVPPLERLQKWCEYVYEIQAQKAEKYGKVCGCPFASVGSEIATQDEKIREKSQQLMNGGRKYLETAIADAIREGLIPKDDPVALAHRVHTMLLGMLLEAKVQNSLDSLKNMEPIVMGLLGVKAVPA